MEALYKLINLNYINISRFAFQLHPEGHRLFQDLDELIIQKDSFTEYIKFEYSTAIIFNIIVSIPSMMFLYINFGNLCYCDWFSTLWLFVVSLIKLIEIIPKAIIIYQTVRISNNSNDELVASRRLMYLTRSNLFFFNTILGYMLLINYSIYFLFIRKSNICENAPQFHFIINWLIFAFFLRLIISFVNYFLHFKYGVNEADIEQTNFYKSCNNRVSKDVLDMIEIVQLTKKNLAEVVTVSENNETDLCCICMLQFEIGENVKALPCNKKHVFHDKCIDKWLSHNKACPTCRTEINKKLLNRNKFY